MNQLSHKKLLKFLAKAKQNAQKIIVTVFLKCPLSKMLPEFYEGKGIFYH
jgi:hypothetical protein